MAMPLLARIFLGLLVGTGLMGSVLPAPESGFTATLSPAQQAAAGLATLTADERACLDRLVAAESIPGREIYSALNANFDRRQTAEARQQAGLDRLSPEQLDQLNGLVASALAPRPKPKDRPRIKDSEILAEKAPPEIHGALTVGLGWGGGGTSRYGALQLEYYDPEHGFSLGIGLESYSGPGRFGYYPYDAYSGFSGAAMRDLPGSGHPVWINGGFSGRSGFITQPGIRQYFEPQLGPPGEAIIPGTAPGH
jgi:hypothetical protein